MADSIFDVEPPRWLQEIAKPIDTKLTGQVLASVLSGITNASQRQHQLVPSDKPGQPLQERGGSWFSNFLGAAAEAKMSMADPFWRIKAQQLQNKMIGEGLDIIQQSQVIAMNRTKMANEAQDLDEIPAWLQDHPTPESRLNATWPTGRSPAWRATLNQLKSTDTRSQQSRLALDAAHSYTNRLNSLAKEGTDGELAAAQLRAIPIPDTGPSAEMLIALGNAETNVARARRAAADAAAAAAKAAGSTVPRVKIGPSGQVTTTWGPPTEKSSMWSDPDMPPPVETLSSGEVVEPVWNGRHWQLFRNLPGEKPARITPAQIGKRIEELRFDAMVQAGRDPAESARLKARADQLESYLSEVENAQINRSSPTKPAGPAAPAGTNVTTYVIDPTTHLLVPRTNAPTARP